MDVANFSDLVNKPRETLAGLTGARATAVRLHRRGGDADLMLTTAERYERDQVVVAAAARLLAELLRDVDALTGAQLRRVLQAVFAWSAFLDDEDLREFAGELTDTVRAAAELDNLAPVTTVIAAWRHSAEISADPELVKILTQPADDHGVIAAPDAA
ncbi:hypothetical protein GCM10010123_45950 [Pilimelia anulata]|uniref:Prevent-host-death family protein n=1 Tax=Pilimelia anulata TaxID=53371 RepID=A0A8J3FDE5_9ACTN|nr:hypothetical protein GCM10010123_45950 [Pilimelia anulata]